MTFPIKLSSIAWLGMFIFSVTLFECASPKIQQTTIGNAWSGNSVNTVIFRQAAIVSNDNIQITAYYNDSGQLILAKRNLPNGGWITVSTPFKGNIEDAHNSISLAIDGNGYIHLAWNHHDSALNYAISSSPMNLEFERLDRMIGDLEDKVTYPEFRLMPNGNLIFLYRNGASGNGQLVLNSFNKNEKIWQRTQSLLIDGEGLRNPYWQSYVSDAGRIHLSWVWRETWDASTNHDLYYIYSDDGGKEWKDYNNNPLTLPITKETLSSIWNIPPNSSLINQTSMVADHNETPFIATYWREENKNVQYKIIYLKNGLWKKVDIPLISDNFQLGGGGTKKIPISRPQILVSANDSNRWYLLVRYDNHGNKIELLQTKNAGQSWVLKSLSNYNYGDWEPNIDEFLWRKRQKLHIFGLRVNQIDGEGVAKIPQDTLKIIEVSNLK
ncbi:BNR repeat-containing protein [Aegicerativicinus sediminis]